MADDQLIFVQKCGLNFFSPKLFCLPKAKIHAFNLEKTYFQKGPFLLQGVIYPSYNCKLTWAADNQKYDCNHSLSHISRSVLLEKNQNISNFLPHK
jgi:hypothetical protein